MEQNNMQMFDFEGHQTRVVMKDGAPWWVGKDVCDVLGYVNSRKAIEDHCKHVSILKSNDSLLLDDDIPARGLTIIPESDVYRLIIRSNMPEAERFETWVMEEVLPSIRKHGAYIMPHKIDELSENPDMLKTLVQSLKNEQDSLILERNKVKQLERQIQDNALNTSSGQILQDSFCNKKTVVIGQFNKIQREGNLILAWLSSDETPVVGYTGLDTNIHRDKRCNVYHLDYDFPAISEKE